MARVNSGQVPCSVPGCDGKSDVPGAARGYCTRHYQRWQKHGDVHRTRPRRVGVAPCSIEGCDELVKARGWCVKHWTRWQRSGHPQARLAGEVREGCRICPRCGEDKPLAIWAAAYCRECVNAMRREWCAAHPKPPVAGEPRDCGACGQTFMANRRRSRYCSENCFRAHKNKANWKNSVARRARMRTAFVEVFDRREIFERDDWVCRICGDPVDREAHYRDARAPSLDHIVPIARGGEHSRANAQTACLGCNVRKGTRLMEEV